MRFAERFLVAFAFIALLMRYAGLKDGATMELIAMPLLAAHYLLAMPFFLFRKSKPVFVLSGVMTGVGFGYCIISLLLYTLRWLPLRDMLENCCIILTLIIIGSAYMHRRMRDAAVRNVLLRALLLLVCILLAALLPLPIIARP